MKETRWNFIFCLLFCLICVLPLAGMLILGPSQAASNEILASAPALREKDGSRNVDFLSDLTAWFDDRFAFRQELVTANAHLTAAVFRESGAQSVVLGRGGWLYYADTLPDYEGTAPMTERQLFQASRSLALMQEYARGRGVSFVFAAAPNKNTLYPQYMPARYEKSAAPSNLERLTELLAAQGVNQCDLTALFSAYEPVYHRTDSHWDGYGSALAHDALLKSLGREASLASEEFVETAHTGDLYEMLFPAGKAADTGPVLARARSFSYVGGVRGPDDMTIRTAAETGSGSLLMFRDSFGNTLHADLAESFAAACFSRAMPYNLTFLDRERADTLIVEIVERNLIDLAENPPVFPGPVRDLALPEASVSAQATVETGESPIEGCVLYAGAVDCAEMNADSPVYLALDGTVYEATPAGGTGGAFALHAPAAAEIQILIRCGGEWKAAAVQ